VSAERVASSQLPLTICCTPLVADAHDLGDGSTRHASAGGFADRLFALSLRIGVSLRCALQAAFGAHPGSLDYLTSGHNRV